MTYPEVLKRITPEFEQLIAVLEKEVAQMRTGQASPSLVAELKIPCFGQEFVLKQLAVVSALSPREIVIQPWDVSYLEPIASALDKTSFGPASLTEKGVLRLSLPPLTEEYRRSFLKLLSEKLEEQRISFRKIRDKAWRELQEGEKQGWVREDDKFKGRDELDKLVKKYNEKLEEVGEKKKKELME